MLSVQLAFSTHLTRPTTSSSNISPLLQAHMPTYSYSFRADRLPSGRPFNDPPLTQDARQVQFSFHSHRRLSFPTTSNTLSVLLLLLSSCPTALAQHAPPNDLYTSSPDSHGLTPILNLLTSFIRWVVHTLSFNHDDLPHIAKRMSDTHIVEACMIPVLVALSGMFAGLTLG